MSDLVSIVVPVYNAENYILKTLNSVLEQTYTEWEMIVVDDGSADESMKRVKELSDARIRLVSNDGTKGVAGARNKGISLAKGRYLAFLDADDIWKPEKLAKTVRWMQENDAAFGFTAYEFGDANAKGTGKVVSVPSELDYEHALSRTVIFTSTVMFDLEKVTKEDIFMPQVKSEDTATWWRILRSGIKAYGLNENLVVYRRAGNSLSSNKIEAMRRIWNLYRNEEKLSVGKSMICFAGWAVRAVARRL